MFVLIELMLSWSLLVLLEVNSAVRICSIVGLFSLVKETVTLVFGDPIEEISVVIGFC